MADGSLIFDTKVDTTGFSSGANSIKQQATSIQSTFKKVGKAIAAAFTVKKIVDFGNEAVNLASDLQEVQNVVDTAFGDMSYKMEEFADTCIEMYGMSKLTAKQMGSTFMAMAKGMGQATDVASDKAIELTGRLGDIMSFYNKTADEVNTIGKAIYSGETEPLKAIGIIMTETNLKTYALSKGYEKLYSEMSPAEKLLVRQEYFLEQTSMAAGDFVDTQNSWANQTRILSERWKEFMTIIGNALVQVLTPAVKTLNSMVASLVDVGNELSSIFGITVTSDVSSGAANASEELEAMGDSAEEALKKAEGGTASFDELEIIGGTETGSEGVGTEAGIKAIKEEAAATEETEKATSALEETINDVGDALKWLGKIFQTSFLGTFGDKNCFDAIITSFSELKDSVLNVFNSSQVKTAAVGFVESYVGYLGTATGTVMSVGTSYATNLVAGIKQSLNENKEQIQTSIASLFNIGSRLTEISAGFETAIARISDVFRGDSAVQLSADIFSIFSDAAFNVLEFLGTFATDVAELLTTPFVENQESIKTAIESTFQEIIPILETFRGTVNDIFGAIRGVYDEKIHPLITSLKDGFVMIGTKLLEVYNMYILPVITYASQKFDEFRQQALGSLINKFMDFAGAVTDCISVIWNEALLPFILWFIKNIAPEIKEGLTSCIDMFFLLWNGVCEVAGYILDTLQGLADFVTGIFTGDWSKAWEGAEEIFNGFWMACESLSDLGAAALQQVFGEMLKNIETTWKQRMELIKNFFSDVWLRLRTTTASAMTGIKNIISTGLQNIKTRFTDIFTNIKNTVTKIFDDMWLAIKGVINGILGGVEVMANGVVSALNKVIKSLNNISVEIPSWVPKYGGKSFGFDIPTIKTVTIPKLATGTVVPANYGEFTAILGDNKREPEVVSPISTMKKAFKEAISELDGSWGNITLLVELDGEVVYKNTVQQDRRYKKQTGKSAFYN